MLLARIGFGAKGIVHLVVGALAVRGAVAVRDTATDGFQGALWAISRQPFGRVALSALAVGLAVHGLWCLKQAIKGRAGERPSVASLARRFGQACGAVVYVVLAGAALRLLLGEEDGGRGAGAARQSVAAIMELSHGRWIVAATGAGLLVAGAHQGYLAVTAGFRETFDLERMSAVETRWAMRVGRAGHAARALVWSVLGVLLVEAARLASAASAGGVGTALDALGSFPPFGTALLAAAGVGLFCYGLHCLVEARFRRVAFL